MESVSFSLVMVSKKESEGIALLYMYGRFFSCHSILSKYHKRLMYPSMSITAAIVQPLREGNGKGWWLEFKSLGSDARYVCSPVHDFKHILLTVLACGQSSPRSDVGVMEIEPSNAMLLNHGLCVYCLDRHWKVIAFRIFVYLLLMISQFPVKMENRRPVLSISGVTSTTPDSSWKDVHYISGGTFTHDWLPDGWTAVVWATSTRFINLFSSRKLFGAAARAMEKGGGLSLKVLVQMQGNSYFLTFVSRHIGSPSFSIFFTNENRQRQHVWQTSWAISTRFVGGIIATHGDDAGLMLPPRLASVQMIIKQLVNKVNILAMDALSSIIVRVEGILKVVSANV
ncbi:Aminoacyl-tRNA synthetase, class II [Artemisia annua]|uniref:Aminoacyl-tRNA synthetase, class II n=1 Tax=Artemisia annua TaxID=35608 RepID=A0A2U1Q5E1_ARTAN|nr:Aminoacyl-tRNA synthetase, class II [Artemisia annua]